MIICLQVWAVLKPGFLALLNDPFDNKLLHIIVFSELPVSTGKEGSQAHLADHVKERNPLRYTFKVSHFCTSAVQRVPKESKRWEAFYSF